MGENFKVKCIDSYMELDFTKGKVYEVVDGYITGDDGFAWTSKYTKDNFFRTMKICGIKFEPIEEEEEATMLFVGDKIELLDDRWVFKKGEQFEVTEIGNGMINIKSNNRIVIMNQEYIKYFKVVEDIKPIEKCEWASYFKHSYRTNGELIHFVSDNWYETYSKCVNGDKFDLQKGLDICLNKAKIMEINSQIKDLKSQKQKYEEELHMLSK